MPWKKNLLRCVKCYVIKSHFLFQARYRQYFEEEPDPNMDAGMIPIETQVLMQEVLTDGMAFCSLM